ncbi:ABC transporter permease [Virgisporangium aurantiacum]|uniref:ABC transporter permease n=1 Tax=Virgisporangium aurantiacum TaxID=175570 RepID=A0A8J4E4R1_9ACTN|nr:ABC-2 family transporter protein [Virgisporangium aurantiacum]GIJ61496.1 ABC transporter permease [Virgisporangium aurantiacum]
MYLALAKAGFRRHATYRIATLAGATTNVTFGFLRYYTLLAVAVSAGGTVAGYDGPKLATYVWCSQGILAVVSLWGDIGERAERIRTGDVVVDLLRPIDPVWHQLAGEAGRATYHLMTRFTLPVLAGLVFTDMYLPRRAVTYPLFVVSLALAVAVCFACRFIVQCAAYWTLDIRGPMVLWLLLSGLGSGLFFPLWLVPEPWSTLAVYALPFASIVQVPMDILVERSDHPYLTVLVQAFWAVVIVSIGRSVQRRAERKLVVQGG